MTASREARVVELRLAGKQPAEISRAIPMPINEVFLAIREAKKAGIQFPALPKARPSRDGKLFHMSLDDLSSTGAGAVARAAQERGITAQEYMDRRTKAVAMATAGRPMHEVMEAVNEPERVIKSWYSQARVAGHDIPYSPPIMTAEIEEVAAPPAQKAKSRIKYKTTYWTNPDELLPQHRAMAERAAAALNVDLAEYAKLRIKALDLFRRNMTSPSVAAQIGIDAKQAGAWLQRARVSGALQRSDAAA